MKKILILSALLLSACKHDVATVQSVSTVYVDRPAPCPAKAEREKLLADRPVPLRQNTMPPKRVERVARSEAQLGKYEAEGGWADKVVSALKRCGQQ